MYMGRCLFSLDPIQKNCKKYIKRGLELFHSVLKSLFVDLIGGRQHYGLIRKEKAPFCHSVRVASALNGPITTVCTANAYIP
jgi:hypothetical protein